ncbi:venom protease-like isoform X2 [Epargyreus clarus]|uniref:venom protease-like isoform X2 n=1 Tax=Epargyreus clarus TaxID=520877 RepID=UPI003C2F8C7F
MKCFKEFLILAVMFSCSVAWKDSTQDLEQVLLDILSNKTSIEDNPEIQGLTGQECYAVIPDAPNFLTPGRRISASSRLYLIREIKKGTVPEIFFVINSPVIFGGRPANAGEFPHMGAVGWKSKDPKKAWSFKCGSTLISEKFVLTAGHCTHLSLRLANDIADPIPKIIRLGVENIEEDAFNVNGDPVDKIISRIIVNPKFAPPKRYNDIALMELESKVTFDLNLIPACLWSRHDTTPLGNKVALTGWGYTENGHLSDALQVAYVDILDSQQCDGLLNKKRSRHWQGFAYHQICAGNLLGGVDTCQGDSGGPVQVKIDRGNDTEANLHMVIAVTSFGIKCGKKDLPGVYTRVSSFIRWIENNVWGDIVNNTNNMNNKIMEQTTRP